MKRKMKICRNCKHYTYLMERTVKFKIENHKCALDLYEEVEYFPNESIRTSGYSSVPTGKYINWSISNNCPYILEHIVME